MIKPVTLMLNTHFQFRKTESSLGKVKIWVDTPPLVSNDAIALSSFFCAVCDIRFERCPFGGQVPVWTLSADGAPNSRCIEAYTA